MLHITLTPEAAEGLRALLAREHDNARIRIREFKTGCGTCSKNFAIVLRLSIDEQEDEDVEGHAESLPFIIDRDLVDQYGTEFSVAMDANAMYLVTAKHWKIAPFKQTRC